MTVRGTSRGSRAKRRIFYCAPLISKRDIVTTHPTLRAGIAFAGFLR